MFPQLDNYDWEEAFGYANGGKNACNSGTPVAVRFVDEDIDTSPFDREDVVEIIKCIDGENDEEDWLGLFRLRDGRYAFIEAWCDYTGWDCQSGGCATVANRIEDLIRWGMSKEQRKRLGLQLEGEE